MRYLQDVSNAFTALNDSILPFVAAGNQTLNQTLSFTPYSSLSTAERANISAATYDLSEQLTTAATALGAEVLRPRGCLTTFICQVERIAGISDVADRWRAVAN